jgi:hypothetical protein
MENYTNEELKLLLSKLYGKIIKKKNELDKLLGEVKKYKKLCNHNDVKVEEWGSATCNICGEYFSWYCPTSPTLECDYEQEDGSYDEDNCRYCGQPEEKK